MEVDPQKESGASEIGPLAGLDQAAWIPLRFREQSLGLALLGYARARPLVELEAPQRLAEELALAVSERRSRELLERTQQELKVRAALYDAILSGVSTRQTLRQVAAEVARHLPAQFIALAKASGSELQFEMFEGPQELASLTEKAPILTACRTALDERRIVVSDCADTHRALNESHDSDRVSSVAALPLEVRGELLGLLLVGFTPGAEAGSAHERLEPYAALAAAMLWEEKRQQAAAALEASYRAVLESTSEAILVIDAERVIRQASRKAREIAQLEGQVRLEELFAASSREAVESWAKRASTFPHPIEAPLLSGVVVRVIPRDTLPVGGGLELCLEDATASERAERSGKQVESELFAVLDSVDSGILLLDATGCVRLANGRLAQLFDLDARLITELTDFESLVGAVQDRFRDPQAATRRWCDLYQRGDEAAWDELELGRPTRRVLERFARPVFDAEGNRIGWLEVYRDITSQRLIQSKLLQTEKMAAVGQLVSGIAHELNNPLTSIMGYAQLLLGRLGPSQIADAQKICQEAERARRIVKNLLVFARESKLERQPVDLNEIVERTLALRSYELKLENIAVELELDREVPRTLADGPQLQQVALNLVVNAEQAILQGRGQGHIRIRTGRVAGKHLLLQVSDDGPGIPPEIVSRIFDPFFTTKPPGLGTGLGLSIVYGIVQEHGGEISVDSQPGQGTTFTVELPIVVPPAKERAREEPERVVLTTAGPARRVLVVEDEPTVAQLIADVLREEHHQVDVVLDSQEGLNRIARHHYDLVICDLKMPRLDGQSFYNALVGTGSPAQHHIMFTTGDTLATRTLEFLERNGLPYLAKPFLVEELKLAVSRLLESSGSEPGRADLGESTTAGRRHRHR